MDIERWMININIYRYSTVHKVSLFFSSQIRIRSLIATSWHPPPEVFYAVQPPPPPPGFAGGWVTRGSIFLPKCRHPLLWRNWNMVICFTPPFFLPNLSCPKSYQPVVFGMVALRKKNGPNGEILNPFSTLITFSRWYLYLKKYKLGRPRGCPTWKILKNGIFLLFQQAGHIQTVLNCIKNNLCKLI